MANPHNPTRPPLHRSKGTSADQNAAMHQIIRSWDSLTSMPAGCRTVSFSSWTRFSPHSRNTSKTGLKASVLCADAGITPDFDPPLLERAYLGIDQPIESEEPVMEMKRVNRKKREKRHDSGVSSWTIESASTSMAASTRARGMMSSSKPITFRKIEVKTPSPSNSLLTEAVVRASMVRARELQRPCIMKEMAREFGITVLSTERLPESCFDDSDDEE